MWAVQNGVKGPKSKALALFATQKTIITDTEGTYFAFRLFFISRNQIKGFYSILQDLKKLRYKI